MLGYSKGNKREQAALAGGVSARCLCGQGTKLRLVVVPEGLRCRPVGSGKLHDRRGTDGHP